MTTASDCHPENLPPGSHSHICTAKYIHRGLVIVNVVKDLSGKTYETREILQPRRGFNDDRSKAYAAAPSFTHS